MKYKGRTIIYRLINVIALLVSRLLVFPTKPEAMDKPVHILVVYPEEADRISRDDGPAALARVIVSLGYECDYLEAENAKEHINEYEQVIWCATAESERLDPTMLNGYRGHLLILGDAYGLENVGLHCPSATEKSISGSASYSFYDDISFYSSVPLLHPGVFEDADYTAGILETANGPLPLVSAKGDIRYIALYDYTSEFAKAVLMQEIPLWLCPYGSGIDIYTEYIVLDEIYPYTDPYRLAEIVEYLASRHISFVISVMPIYQNTDYPAMQHFCDILRFAQSNGGAVILHAPIVQNGIDAKEMAKQLTTGMMSYIDNGVYPLAIEIPSEWIFSKDITSLLGRYRTIFLADMDAFPNHPADSYGCGDFLRPDIQKIQPALKLDDNGISHLGRCSTAVYLNIAELEDNELYSAINTAAKAPIPMQTLWAMDTYVNMEDGHYLSWNGSTLKVDGEERVHTYTPSEPDSDHDYKRDSYYRIVANLSRQNHFLIGLSIVVLLMFLLMIRRSRKQMHDRFLHKKGFKK